MDAELCENQRNRNDFMPSALKSYERSFSAHAGSLWQVSHKMRENDQSLDGDAERGDASSSPERSPSNSSMQTLKTEFCDREFCRRRAAHRKQAQSETGRMYMSDYYENLGYIFTLIAGNCLKGSCIKTNVLSVMLLLQNHQTRQIVLACPEFIKYASKTQILRNAKLLSFCTFAKKC